MTIRIAIEIYTSIIQLGTHLLKEVSFIDIEVYKEPVRMATGRLEKIRLN